MDLSRLIRMPDLTQVTRRVMATLPTAPAAISPTRPLAPAPAGSGLRAVMGEFGWPGVGWSINWIYQGPFAFEDHRSASYGPVSWAGALGREVVLVASADGVAQVLLNADGHWSSEDGWTWMIGPFFSGGLMLQDDPEHHRDRRIMANAFTRRRLEAYLARIQPVTATAIDAWGAGEHQAYPFLKQLTLDVATDVFLDEELDGHDAGRVNQAFVDCVRAATGFVRTPMPLGLPVTRWQRGLDGRKVLQDHFAARVPAHRVSDGDDLLTALCHVESEDGQRFTDAQVVDQMIFLMMAAHDTSTITTTAVMGDLARNPAWQQRVRQESLALGTDTPSFAQLGQLEALDLVVKESLRRQPPVPVVSRRATADTVVDGHHVPAGSHAWVAVQAVHHDPTIWTEPDRFDPDRFGPDRREDAAHRHAYVPFGGGAHKCIGMHFGMMEVKTILHQLVCRYEISAEDTPTTWDWTSLPVPLDGMPVTLTPIG